MKKVVALTVFLTLFIGCNNERPKSSDERQKEQSEVLLAEATSQVGMPNITNFRERRIVKDILELRDQNGLVTYTYLYCEMTGKLKYLGESVGYGVPYSTQFTSPQKVERYSHAGSGYSWEVVPQADPNGLFAPASSTATWVMLKDPNSDKVSTIYVEPLIVVSPFKLPATVADYPDIPAEN